MSRASAHVRFPKHATRLTAGVVAAVCLTMLLISAPTPAQAAHRNGYNARVNLYSGYSYGGGIFAIVLSGAGHSTKYACYNNLLDLGYNNVTSSMKVTFRTKVVLYDGFNRTGASFTHANHTNYTHYFSDFRKLKLSDGRSLDNRASSLCIYDLA